MKQLNFDSGKNLLLRWAGVKKILPKEIFWYDVRSKVKQMIKELLEYGLNKELEAILKADIRRTELREGQRNGYRRSLGNQLFLKWAIARNSTIM